MIMKKAPKSRNAIIYAIIGPRVLIFVRSLDIAI